MPQKTTDFGKKGSTLTCAETRRLETLEKRYRNAARQQFESRVACYHRITGGNYTSVTVRDQKHVGEAVPPGEPCPLTTD